MEENNMTIDQLRRAQETVNGWRTEGMDDSPAGPLYSGGRYAQADLAQRTGSGTQRCGTACSGSRTYYCC